MKKLKERIVGKLTGLHQSVLLKKTEHFYYVERWEYQHHNSKGELKYRESYYGRKEVTEDFVRQLKRAKSQTPKSEL